MGMKLFEDDEGKASEDISKIEINKEFARRYEHNKKREDLQRLQELKKKGVVESSEDESSSEASDDEEEEEVGLVSSSNKDLEFFDALLKVKNQDPVLKQKDVALFHSDDEEEDDNADEGNKAGRKEKKKKAKYLKDVVAEQLIEEGPEFDDDDDEDRTEHKVKSYAEEQEDIRKEFLKAVEEADADDEDGDLFRAKAKEESNGNDKDENFKFQKKLDEYFGGQDQDLDENSKFLKEFFMNKLWVDKSGKSKSGIDEEQLDELIRDEEEIEKQEEYETNYRHEETAEDRVQGFARHVDGSVRKKTNARKEQRKNKEERMKIAEMERKEELKHLKNLKKQEMMEKLRKIREIAGIGEDEMLPLNEDDLEDDFDPDEYDKLMNAAFGEKYYNADDSDLRLDESEDGDEHDLEKPNFEEEDELLGLPKCWDVCGSGDGFTAVRERFLSSEKDDDPDADADADADSIGGKDEELAEDDEVKQEGGAASEEGKRKRKRKVTLLERAKEAMMEELYKLDYEDSIGDLKTRFKYAKVEPNRYGLKADELWMFDDKELNQYVSLKKIAPYREKEHKVPNSKRYQQKMLIKEILHGKKTDDKRSDKRKRPKDEAKASTSGTSDADDGKLRVEGPNSDMDNLSRKAKRRHRQKEKEVKMSDQRRMAYANVAGKPMSKRKH